MRWLSLFAFLALALTFLPPASARDDDGFETLFDGTSLDAWKVPESGIWELKDGIIHGDVRKAGPGEQSLWTKKSYKDFILTLEWRIWETPFKNRVPDILPDGSHKKGEDGKEIRVEVDEADSGVYLRGSPKSQVNIWRWPVGSGEVYGYRTDGSQSAAVRAGVTPKKNADKPVGEWNAFVITMKGDRLTVVLNGETVIENAELPKVPADGPIALQAHGGYDKDKGRFTGPPSQVDFRNIKIKELK